LFSAHQRQYTNELAESYEDDCAAANDFLDATQKAAPRAEDHYLEGNHEAHAERYAAQAYASKRDADGFLERNAPAAMLRLKQRSIRYYRRQTCYQGIAIPGTIRIGRCYYTHGICHGTNATRQHLVRFCDNVVHGHTHRAAAVVERSVTKHAYGAWCPGTLSKLQPLYMHTSPSNWTHGYAVQFVAPSGRFLHVQVPIVNGESLLDLIPNLG
jgi:predicted phosphodiesterase